VGLACSATISGFAFKRGSLSASGSIAACALGTAIYAGGGAAWFGALLAFFATSTLLGRVGRSHKAALKQEYEKGDTRDALQVFCNGGIAGLCALGMLLVPHPAWAAGFVGALATANGDTWATELGVLSRGEPYTLMGFRRVPRGTSGAVSALGVLATLGGGAVVGLACAIGAGAFSLAGDQLLLLGSATGVLGSLIDSLLGATLQRGYHCDRCERATESPTHSCGSRTRPVRGLPGFSNDVVNLLATACGALLGVGIWLHWMGS
jgi:uncharacterized protein (TIGR00297 family)